MTSATKLNEDTPLLSSKLRSMDWDDAKTPAKKVAHWYIIPPIFAVTFTIGALYPSMIQVYTTVFCHRYYQQLSDDGVVDIPLKNCTIPEVQAIVSEAQAIFMFLPYATTLFLATYYGALSDRKGRRPVLLISGIGGLFTMTCYILTIKYYEFFGITLLFLAPVVKGILAGDTVLIAAANAYITDCTTPKERTLAFGHLMATIFLGTTLGPMIASLLLKQTESIDNVFYMCFVVALAFQLYVLFILPESHDYKNHKAPVVAKNQTLLQRLNIFSALSILHRGSSKHTNRYALAILAGIQCLVNLIALPPTILYAMLKFGWTAYESGLFISLSSSIRFMQMVIVLPLLSKLFHKNRADRTSGEENDADIQIVLESTEIPHASSSIPTLSELSEANDEETHNEKDIKHSILFDSWMLRSGFVFDTISFVVYALVTTSSGFAANTILHSFSMIAIPSIRSLMTTMVKPSQIGEMLGAMAVLDTVSMMISQLGLNTIYSASVGTMPTLTFYVCAVISALALVLSFFVYPIATITKSNDNNSTEESK